MLTFQIEPNAGPKIGAYMERVRSRIIAAARSGMREAMNDLAQWIVESKLSGGFGIGIQSAPSKYTNPGDLAASLLKGVRVSVRDELVRGTLTARPKNMPNLGFWQEFGTNHPAVSDKLNVFTGRDGKLVFTHHLAAFSIPPRPFLNPSLEEQKAQIMETIRASIAAADLT